MTTLSALLSVADVVPQQLILRLASILLWTLGQLSGSGGQSGQGSTSVSLGQGLDIMISLGWLIGAVALLIVTTVVLRKWLLSEGRTGAGAQFTMADLRDMRDQGLMTPEEFDRAKLFLVSRGKALLVESDDKQAQTAPKVTLVEENDTAKDSPKGDGDKDRDKKRNEGQSDKSQDSA